MVWLGTKLERQDHWHKIPPKKMMTLPTVPNMSLEKMMILKVISQRKCIFLEKKGTLSFRECTSCFTLLTKPMETERTCINFCVGTTFLPATNLRTKSMNPLRRFQGTAWCQSHLWFTAKLSRFRCFNPSKTWFFLYGDYFKNPSCLGYIPSRSFNRMLGTGKTLLPASPSSPRELARGLLLLNFGGVPFNDHNVVP